MVEKIGEAKLNGWQDPFPLRMPHVVPISQFLNIVQKGGGRGGQVFLNSEKETAEMVPCDIPYGKYFLSPSLRVTASLVALNMECMVIRPCFVHLSL